MSTAADAPAQDASAIPADPRKAARREMSTAVLVTAAGSGLLLLTAGRTWLNGTVDVHGAAMSVSASGNTVTGVPKALSLMGLAACLAVFATRGVFRRLVGVLTVLAGAGVVAASVMGAFDHAALNGPAAERAAVTSAHAVAVSATPWPWFAAVAGLLMVTGGVLTTMRGARWSEMSSRYDAPGGDGRRAAKRPNTSADLWNALDRGEDPTD